MLDYTAPKGPGAAAEFGGWMARFFKGVGVGTHWHGMDPTVHGFTPPRGGPHSIDTVLEHISGASSRTPYLSITVSFEVACVYAAMGAAPPVPGGPKPVVYELELSDAAPYGLFDPVRYVAQHAPDAFRGLPYQHDGHPGVILAIAAPYEARLAGVLRRPIQQPPGFSGYQYPRVSPYLKAIVRAIRDSELLVQKPIPPDTIVHRHELTLPSPTRRTP